ncbi:MAG TPA: mechanosensitive ion channel family protein [Candidatus Fraserbacteria bacterium]|nr:mechanosensitive ion channel family protein [Candidatus Fraserbacteria bacterium]
MTPLDWIYYGNTLWSWLLALLIAIATMITLKISKGIIVRRLSDFAQKTATKLDDLVADLLGRTKLVFLLLLAVYIGSLALALPEVITRLISGVVVIALLFQAAIWGNGLISFFISRYLQHKMKEDVAGAATVNALGFISRLILWSVILLLVLDNLGVNITAMIAGLGVGGIAVALAVQNILGDLFASLSIMLDRPFEIGDFIIVGEHLGTVEHIGLKTTRLRSLSGEQIVFANNDLLNSRVRNYKRMFERRVVFSIGVIYQTPVEKLEAIPPMIREAVEAQEQTRFDRAHFKAYGDFALVFEVVYYVKNPDYNVYMDIQQAINLTLFRHFQEQGIEFAYPTQTLYLRGAAGDDRPQEHHEHA